jgi:Arc/MetJ-type ribon-helix-helix transcriptional regulator
MSNPPVSARMSDELRLVLDLNTQRGGFASRAAYLKYLVRRDAMKSTETDIAAMVARVGDAGQDDFDAALLKIVEAREEKRPSLLVILGNALASMLNPSSRRDLRWNPGSESRGFAFVERGAA